MTSHTRWERSLEALVQRPARHIEYGLLVAQEGVRQLGLV